MATELIWGNAKKNHFKAMALLVRSRIPPITFMALFTCSIPKSVPLVQNGTSSYLYWSFPQLEIGTPWVLLLLKHASLNGKQTLYVRCFVDHLQKNTLLISEMMIGEASSLFSQLHEKIIKDIHCHQFSVKHSHLSQNVNCILLFGKTFLFDQVKHIFWGI